MRRAGSWIRAFLGSVVLFAALSALVAPVASAEIRSYASQMTGLGDPEAVAIDSSDDVWVSDLSNSLLSKYDPYPSQNRIDEQTGGGNVWGGGYQVRSLATSADNGFLYVGVDTEEGAVCGGTPFAIFDNYGNLFRKEQPDYEIFGSACQMWFAVSNGPQTDNFGRYYLYTGHAPSILSQYDGYGNPVNFIGSAGYIHGNQLTGNPKREFPREAAGAFSPAFSGVAVDPNSGNIWVIVNDYGYEAEPEIDEFAPTGIFIRRITAKDAGVPPSVTPAANPPTWSTYPGLSGIAVDPTNGDVLVSDRAGLVVDEFTPQGKYVGQLTGADTPAGGLGYRCVDYYGDPHNRYCEDHAISIAVNSQGYVYITDGFNHVVDIFSPLAKRPKITDEPDTNPTTTGGTLNATVDPDGGGDITSCHADFGTDAEFKTNEYKLGPIPCVPDPSGSNFTGPTQVHADVSGLTPESVYHYRFVVGNADQTQVGADHVFIPHDVLGLRADPASDVAAEEATLNGSFVGNGSHTTYWFEYGTNVSYGEKVPLPAPPGGDAGSPAGPGRTPLEVHINDLVPVTRYHYRIVADNGSLSKSADQSFRTTPLAPSSKGTVSDVHSDQLVLHAAINPGGADTVYSFEYGKESCLQVPDPCTVAFSYTHIGSNLGNDDGSKKLTGLEPATTYFYRVIATNRVGTTYSPERTFTTYPFRAELSDPCPNVLSRQQTGAALLSDCRSYELVSSAHAGGYDVESSLVPGQTPYDGYPRAENPLRVLYGVHNGAIPGVPGNPTNRGVDPYLATRSDRGWTTSYVGIPANNPFAASPFSSTLAEADPGLDTFAFAGPEICSPCFADGSGGVPLHLADGSLVQGMKGSLNPAPPATEDGLVGKRFSGDGRHFVFSSTSQFEPDGNDSTGDVSVYDRDLETGATQVVSKDPAGGNLACLQGVGTCHAPGDVAGISELDISEDGSRIVVGQRVSSDADGNTYYHLYMHIGSNPHTVDLTPGASAGALYDGMTSDGAKVFFTTTDQLVAGDTDASADIYEAEVGGNETVTLRLLSVGEGGPSNDDSCSPAGIPNSWNAVSGDGKCGAVALAGGAGVAAEDGTFYFISPELLDAAAEAEGEQDQANLYVVRPGSTPEFVGTIDSSVGKPGPQPAGHSLQNENFIGGLSAPESLAVDQANGDIYIAERESESISRYTSSGTPHNFGGSSGNISGNKITGQYLGFGGESEIAVDNSPGSPFARDLYVSSAVGVRVFDREGEQLGELNGFGESCGVAVDQQTGAVYVGDYHGQVWRFEPVSGATPVSNSNYEVTSIHTEGVSPCPVGTDSSGHVFAIGYGGSQIRQYNASEFEASAPEVSGTAIAVNPSNRIYTDPENDDRYIDTGEKIVWLNSANEVIEEFGSGDLSFSNGVAVDKGSKHVYVSSGSHVLMYALNPATYHPIDNPTVVHAVHDAATHHYGDFQVTPSGRYAAFATRQPLDASFDNLGHAEVYRYDAVGDAVVCVSCPSTNAIATADASLASDGLSLVDDGRVFFDTGEPIVLRDGDNRKDVYEWEERGTGNCGPENPNFFPSQATCLSLISSGTSQFDSSLLSATADGADAYFATHDSLAPEDENGPITKLYDARANGGFFKVPPQALCAASDECHGPGTQPAPPAPIGTRAGLPGNGKEATHCNKGFAKKHGKCVRKRRHRRHHRRLRR